MWPQSPLEKWTFPTFAESFYRDFSNGENRRYFWKLPTGQWNPLCYGIRLLRLSLLSTHYKRARLSRRNRRVLRSIWDIRPVNFTRFFRFCSSKSKRLRRYRLERFLYIPSRLSSFRDCYWYNVATLLTAVMIDKKRASAHLSITPITLLVTFASQRPSMSEFGNETSEIRPDPYVSDRNCAFPWHSESNRLDYLLEGKKKLRGQLVHCVSEESPRRSDRACSMPATFFLPPRFLVYRV